MSRRRGETIGSLLLRIAQGQSKFRMGEIQTMPNGYEFSDKGTTNTSGIYFDPIPTLDGRLASLVFGKRMARNCPAPPGDFPKFKRSEGQISVWVPMALCRKCPHHAPRRRGKAFPSCEMLVQIRKGAPSPIEAASNALSKATAQAKRLLGS